MLQLPLTTGEHTTSLIEHTPKIRVDAFFIECLESAAARADLSHTVGPWRSPMMATEWGQGVRSE